MAIATDTFLSPVSAVEFGVRVADPIDHLTHCHERIARSLVTVRNAVAAFRSSEPVLRTEAAAALDYELALLQLLTSLHIQDEEKSLFPRLFANLIEDPTSLRELIPILESHHREEEGIFKELARCVRTFPAKPGAAADQQLTRLEKLVGQLAGIAKPHMELEDQQIISRCREFLSATDLEGMQQEMRLRFKH